MESIGRVEDISQEVIEGGRTVAAEPGRLVRSAVLPPSVRRTIRLPGPRLIRQGLRAGPGDAIDDGAQVCDEEIRESLAVGGMAGDLLLGGRQSAIEPKQLG